MNPDPLRILAFSDLHGKGFKEATLLVDETHPDWIVLCGDLLPDFSMISGRESRLAAQREFWRTYRSTFIRDYAVTTLVRGNHEIEGFQDHTLGQLPTGLERDVLRLEGIPVEFGGWGWSREWEEKDLLKELQGQLAQVSNPTIFLSHVPPWGILDRTASGEHIGHRPLLQYLQDRAWPRALVLCGHVHESFGWLLQGETMIVNAACGFAIVDWWSGTPSLQRMDRMEALKSLDLDGL